MTLSSISAERPARPRSTPHATVLGLAAAVPFCAFCAAVAVAPVARADVPPRARALARTLFEDGRRLLNEKKFSEACPKLEESMRLDPAPGTQLNVAVCHEGEGRLATAWTEYNDALTQARRDQRPERADFVAARLDALSPQLSFMTIALAPGADVAGLEVVLDGATVGRAVLGVPSPVDPGTHTVMAQAPGRMPFKADVQIGPAGDRNTVSIPILPSATAGDVTPPGPGTVEAPAARDASSHPTRKIVGGTLLGVGAVSLGVGAVFGIRAIGQWSDRNDACAHGCTAEGVARGDAAQTSAWVANITIVAGVAAAAGGTYLLLTSGGPSMQPSAKSARFHAFPFFSATQAGLGLAGEL